MGFFLELQGRFACELCVRHGDSAPDVAAAVPHKSCRLLRHCDRSSSSKADLHVSFALDMGIRPRMLQQFELQGRFACEFCVAFGSDVSFVLPMGMGIRPRTLQR